MHRIFKALNAKKTENGKNLYDDHVICFLLYTMIFWNKAMVSSILQKVRFTVEFTVCLT